jgi:hypothetical protein
MRRSRSMAGGFLVAVIVGSLSSLVFTTGCGARSDLAASGAASNGGAVVSPSRTPDASTQGTPESGGGAPPTTDASSGALGFGPGSGDAGTPSSGPDGAPAPCVDTNSDGKNCGACGHDCLGGLCSAGACLPVLLYEDDDNTPQGLAVDATQVYWVDSEGLVQSVSKDGGARSLLATVARGPTEIALGGDALYWVSQDGTLRRLAPGDPGPVTLASAGGESFGLAVTPTTLYWTTTEFDNAGSQLGAVLATPLDGGLSVPVATGQNVPAWIVAGDTAVDWIDVNSELPMASSSLMQAPLDGGAPVALIAAVAGQSSGTGGIAIDASFVYAANGNLAKLPRDGGPTVPLASGYDNFIAVDATGIYASAVQRIDRIALDGGIGAPLIEQLFNPRGLALDSSAIYYTDQDAVWKLAK